MKRVTSLAVLVLALTGGLSLTAGPASAEPNPVDTVVEFITGAGHCC